MTSKTPSSRWRNAFAVVGAAAVLAAGADTIAYAATGDSLLLGKTNKSSKTTTVKSAKGPALSLKTKKNAPPLAVSSNALVKKLNAEMVSGATLTDLEGPVQRAILADTGAPLDGGGAYRSFSPPAGTYDLIFNGAVSTGASDSWNCLVVDLEKLMGGDLSGVYAYEVGQGSGGFSYSSVFTTAANREIVAGCSGAPGSTATFPIALNLRKVRATTPLAVQPFSPKQAARAADRAGLR